MKELINICDSGKLINLPVGIFSVKILGGWDVVVGNFLFELRNTKNNKIIKPKATIFRVQSYQNNRRAKKIFSLDIVEGGEFIIKFKNINDLVVRYSNLFILRLFEKEIYNRNLEIIIG